MLVFKGTLVHCTETNGTLEILHNKLVGVEGSKIVFLEDESHRQGLQQSYGFSEEEIRALGPSEFLLPGFIDAHIHPTQYFGAGTHLDEQLEQWLVSFQRPLAEKAANDQEFAERINRGVVRRLLKNGTTTAAYFCDQSIPMATHLCDVTESLGQRALIGVLCNELRMCTEQVMYTPEQSAQRAEELIQNVQNRKTDLITPVVVTGCTFTSRTPTLKKLAEVQAKHNVPVHTHLAETLPSAQLTKKINPGYSNETDVFDKCGLLCEKTFMAHGVRLSDEEVQLLNRKKAGIVHCPNSNISLKSGFCDVRRLENNGVKVALGTDVSGGYNTSMLDAMRYAVQTSNVLKIVKEEQGDCSYTPLNFTDALRLATIGSSKVLGMAGKVGNFVVGKEFDALRINLMVNNSPFDVFPEETIEDLVQKFIYLGDDRNIVEVYVAGKNIQIN